MATPATLRDLEKYGIPALLGADEWAAYKGYTLQQYYEPWLRFFQRAPGKVLACAGDVAGTPCPYKLRVDMGADVAILRQQLEFLQMDHSVPKHAICTQWKRAVARWWVEHGGEAHEFTFRTAVDIDFVSCRPRGTGQRGCARPAPRGQAPGVLPHSKRQPASTGGSSSSPAGL